VAVSGHATTDPDRRIDPDRDQLTVDGRPVSRAAPVYLMMHKPKGVVTTRSDEQGRKTVYDVLAAAAPGSADPWIAPVGRLDRDSSGLLLLTNDTRWGNRIASPDHHIPKTYHVRVLPPMTPEDRARLAAGVPLADGPAAPLKVTVIRSSKRGTWLEATLTEGRNRQIRRMCARLGYKVETLVRIRIGDLALGDLRPSEVRVLTDDEVLGLSVGEAISR
jgi:23S rRNA pseudouridine2605 synthase